MAKVKYIQQEAVWRTFQAFRDPSSDGWEVVIEGDRFYVGEDDIEAYIAFFTKLQKASKKEEK